MSSVILEKLLINNVIKMVILLIHIIINRRTITDKITGKEIVLTDDDIDLIERIQASQYPDKSFDPYEVTNYHN